jgi:hypothetical protein
MIKDNIYIEGLLIEIKDNFDLSNDSLYPASEVFNNFINILKDSLINLNISKYSIKNEDLLNELLISIKKLTNLDTLILNGIYFTINYMDIIENIIMNNKKIVKLKLINNMIGKITNLEGLHNLYKICDKISALENLEYLTITNNYLNSLPISVLKKMILNMTHNILINENKFLNIDLSNNNIDESLIDVITTALKCTNNYYYVYYDENELSITPSNNSKKYCKQLDKITDIKEIKSKPKYKINVIIGSIIGIFIILLIILFIYLEYKHKVFSTIKDYYGPF